MSVKKPPKPCSLKGHLLAQITMLRDQQNSAFEKATFVGMTDADVREIDQRRDLIARLLKRLAMIYTQESPAQAEHDELDPWSQKKAS